MLRIREARLFIGLVTLVFSFTFLYSQNVPQQVPALAATRSGTVALRPFVLSPAKIGVPYAYALETNWRARFEKAGGNTDWLTVSPDGLLTGIPPESSPQKAIITVYAYALDGGGNRESREPLVRTFVVPVQPQICLAGSIMFAWCDGSGTPEIRPSQERRFSFAPERIKFGCTGSGDALTECRERKFAAQCTNPNQDGCILQFDRLGTPGKKRFGYFDSQRHRLEWFRLSTDFPDELLKDLPDELPDDLPEQIVNAINGSKVLLSGSILIKEKVLDCKFRAWSVVTQTEDSSNNLIYGPSDLSSFCVADTALILLPVHAIWASVYGVPANINDPGWKPLSAPPVAHKCWTGEQVGSSDVPEVPPQGIKPCDNPYRIPRREAAQSYKEGSIVQPDPPNGYYYRAVQKGKPKTDEDPAKIIDFPPGVGEDVQDGGVCWQNVGTLPGFPAWAASHPYHRNDVVQATPPTGFLYKCVNVNEEGGESGSDASKFYEDAEKASLDHPFNDGTVIWQKIRDYSDENPNPLLKVWYWDLSRFFYNRIAQPGVSQGSISIAPIAPATKGTFDVQVYLSSLEGPGWLGFQGMYEYDRNQADSFNSLTAALTYDLRLFPPKDNPRWWKTWGKHCVDGKPNECDPPVLGIRPMELGFKAGPEWSPSAFEYVGTVNGKKVVQQYLGQDSNIVFGTTLRLPFVLSPRGDLPKYVKQLSWLSIVPVVGLEGGFRVLSHEIGTATNCTDSKPSPSCSPQPQQIFRQVAGTDVTFRFPYSLTHNFLGDRPLTLDYSYRNRWLSYAEPWANLNIPRQNNTNVSGEGQYAGERSYQRITFILPFSAYLNARATWQHGSLPPLYQYVGNLVTLGLTFSNPGVSEH